MNMKRNIIFSILFASLFIVGCKKDDGPIPKDVLINEVPQPFVRIDGGSGSIDLTNLAGFQGKFTVGLLYPNGIMPSKLDVVVRKNNNNGNIKIIQAGVTTFPTTLTISAAQIVTLFGTPIVLGDNYDIGVDIYTADGNKYEAFPVTGAAYGSTGVANQPGFSATVRYSAICAFNSTIYSGNFVVVRDDWQDWFPGDIVTFTQVSATSFSFIDPFARGPLLPVIVNINTGNNVVTIPRVIVGSSWAWAAASSYPNPTVEGTGIVAPCEQTITLNMNYGFGGLAGSTFSGGPYVLILRKQ